MIENAEHRGWPRQKTFLRGKLYYNNRLNVVDCLIRDVSEGGARLVIPEGIAIPDDVELHIPHKDQTFFTRIVWRRGQEIGATFLNGSRSKADDVMARLGRLEDEVSALKRIIKKLKADSGLETDVA